MTNLWVAGDLWYNLTFKIKAVVGEGRKGVRKEKKESNHYCPYLSLVNKHNMVRLTSYHDPLEPASKN